MIEAERRARVLVVEDDELSREVIAAVLEEAGYEVTCMESGDAAVAWLRQEARAPGVVLADLRMPGMVREELAGALRKVSASGTLLVAMSGSRVEAPGWRGFDAFLSKPFTVEEFREALAEVAEAGGVPQEEVVRERGAGEIDPSEPALDEVVYRQLQGMMAAAQVDELYAMCLTDTRRRIGGLREAAAHGEEAAFREVAHAIKGAAGIVGAVEMRAIAERLETEGLGGIEEGRGEGGAGVGGVDGVLAGFLAACERLERILAARSEQGEARTDS